MKVFIQKEIVALVLVCLFIGKGIAQSPAPFADPIRGDLFIAPLPVSMEPKQGYFVINRDTWIMMEAFPAFSFDPVEVFRKVFQQKSGYAINEPK